MNGSILHNNWDTFLLGIPFVFMLLVGFFRLDEVIVAPQQKAVRKGRTFSGADADGNLVLSDPDGTRWQASKLR